MAGDGSILHVLSRGTRVITSTSVSHVAAEFVVELRARRAAGELATEVGGRTEAWGRVRVSSDHRQTEPRRRLRAAHWPRTACAGRPEEPRGGRGEREPGHRSFRWEGDGSESTEPSVRS